MDGLDELLLPRLDRHEPRLERAVLVGDPLPRVGEAPGARGRLAAALGGAFGRRALALRRGTGLVVVIVVDGADNGC